LAINSSDEGDFWHRYTDNSSAVATPAERGLTVTDLLRHSLHCFKRIGRREFHSNSEHEKSFDR
jgi:hypothetical protein